MPDDIQIVPPVSSNLSADERDVLRSKCITLIKLFFEFQISSAELKSMISLAFETKDNGIVISIFSFLNKLLKLQKVYNLYKQNKNIDLVAILLYYYCGIYNII